MRGISDRQEWCFSLITCMMQDRAGTEEKNVMEQREVEGELARILECSNGEMSPDDRVIGMTINNSQFGACAKTSVSVIRLLSFVRFRHQKKKTPQQQELITSQPNLFSVSSDADLHLHLVQAFIMQLSCTSSCTLLLFSSNHSSIQPHTAKFGRGRKEKISGELLPFGHILRIATTDWRQ